MSKRWPDGYVTATTRNGKLLDRIEFKFRYPDPQQIGQAKEALMKRFPDCYTFVNLYC